MLSVQSTTQSVEKRGAALHIITIAQEAKLDARICQGWGIVRNFDGLIGLIISRANSGGSDACVPHVVVVFVLAPASLLPSRR